MARTPGYNITIKAFIPSSKTDFKAQASAAALMQKITENKAIDEDFLATAKIVEIKGAYGSLADE